MPLSYVLRTRNLVIPLSAQPTDKINEKKKTDKISNDTLNLKLYIKENVKQLVNDPWIKSTWKAHG